MMKKLNIRETRQQISHVLDVIASGEEVIITRRGRAAACITAVEGDGIKFPDRTELRASLPPMTDSAATTVRALREDERY